MICSRSIDLSEQMLSSADIPPYDFKSLGPNTPSVAIRVVARSISASCSALSLSLIPPLVQLIAEYATDFVGTFPFFLPITVSTPRTPAHWVD